MNERERAIAHAETIEGWMFRPELEALYDWALEMDSIVEVGSWKGRSTYVLCKGSKGTVTAVDTFQGSPHDAEHMRRVAAAGGSTFGEFSLNLIDCDNLTVLRKESVLAAEFHTDVDMVFIDAGHSYEECLADLKAWLPRTKKLICGHDAQFPSVQRAEIGRAHV